MKVLVCDDNTDGADTLAVLLRSHGHDVRTFYAGGACLREALEWKPSIAFLDIGLPDMTGYGVARQLRVKFGADIMLVAVTAYDSPADRTVSAEAGFDMHLAKPVQFDRLISIAATVTRDSGKRSS
jgi:two-component system, sensor histidine kinase